MAVETCGACRESFTSTTSGDMHRTGKHHIFTGPERRRCLTTPEMEEQGMTRNQRGHWMSPGRD